MIGIFTARSRLPWLITLSAAVLGLGLLLQLS